jgi:hypothetical protein
MFKTLRVSESQFSALRNVTGRESLKLGIGTHSDRRIDWSDVYFADVHHRPYSAIVKLIGKSTYTYIFLTIVLVFNL